MKNLCLECKNSKYMKISNVKIINENTATIQSIKVLALSV